MHGYDLRKRLRGDFGLLSSLSFGSLYPTLARLEADGAVREVRADDRPGAEVRPAPAGAFALTGSISGERAALRARLGAHRATAARAVPGTRGRRVYEITERGEDLFRTLLEADEAKPDDRSFALRWSFARHLDPVQHVNLLSRHRTLLCARLEATRRSAEERTRPLDRYERSLLEHTSESTERDLAWVDRMLAAERTGADAPDGEARPDSSADGPSASTLHHPTATAAMPEPVLQSSAPERSEP